MDNFFSLFQRYLIDKAKGTTLYVPRTLLRANRGRPGISSLTQRGLFQAMGSHQPGPARSGAGLRHPARIQRR